jgi:hypothetical protein
MHPVPPAAGNQSMTVLLTVAPSLPQFAKVK